MVLIVDLCANQRRKGGERGGGGVGHRATDAKKMNVCTIFQKKTFARSLIIRGLWITCSHARIGIWLYGCQIHGIMLFKMYFSFFLSVPVVLFRRSKRAVLLQ